MAMQGKRYLPITDNLYHGRFWPIRYTWIEDSTKSPPCFAFAVSFAFADIKYSNFAVHTISYHCTKFRSTAHAQLMICAVTVLCLMMDTHIHVMLTVSTCVPPLTHSIPYPYMCIYSHKNTLHVHVYDSWYIYIYIYHRYRVCRMCSMGSSDSTSTSDSTSKCVCVCASHLTCASNVCPRLRVQPMPGSHLGPWGGRERQDKARQGKKRRSAAAA